MTEVLLQSVEGLLGFQEAEVWVGIFQAGRTARKGQGDRTQIYSGNNWLSVELVILVARWKDELGFCMGMSLPFLWRAVGSH